MLTPLSAAVHFKKDLPKESIDPGEYVRPA